MERSRWWPTRVVIPPTAVLPAPAAAPAACVQRMGVVFLFGRCHPAAILRPHFNSLTIFAVSSRSSHMVEAVHPSIAIPPAPPHEHNTRDGGDRDQGKDDSIGPSAQQQKLRNEGNDKGAHGSGQSDAAGPHRIAVSGFYFGPVPDRSCSTPAMRWGACGQ